MVHKKLKLVNIAAKNKQIIMINNIPAETKIYADIHHFKFVIRNLLSNAIKFSKNKGIVEINANKYHLPEFVIFSVKDNGIGIAKDKQQHIFAPFNLSAAGTANEAGSSIGLMMCREYITMNGGKIWVESEKNMGATFFFCMKAFPHDKPFLDH